MFTRLRFMSFCNVSKGMKHPVRGISLISKLKCQGFMVKDLRELGLRFFKDKQELLTKYNLSNANDFIKDIFT